MKTCRLLIVGILSAIVLMPAVAGSVEAPNDTGSLPVNRLTVGHPVYLLVDPNRDKPASFMLQNKATTESAYGSLESSDALGTLLANDSFVVEPEANKQFSNFPLDTASIVVNLEQGNLLDLVIPPESSVTVADNPVSEVTIPASAGEAGITLFNPSDVVPAVIDVDGSAEVLNPREVRVVTIMPEEDGMRVKSEQSVVVRLAQQVLSWRSPMGTNSVVTQEFKNPTTCGTAPNTYTCYHAGIDLGVNGNPNGTESIYSMGNGVVALVVSNVTGDDSPCDLDGDWGNRLAIKHLTDYGLVRYSQYAHMYGGSVRSYLSQGRIVASGSVLGKMGCTGKSTGPHLHSQVRKNLNSPPMGNGYYRTTADIDTAGFICAFASGCGGGSSFVGGSEGNPLLPYFSRLTSQPSQSNYDVYAISGQPLYGSITVRPQSATTFTSIGIRGNSPTGAETFSNVASVQLNSTSPALTGNKTYTCTDANGCDYKFFAYIGSNGSNTGQGVAEGYPVKITVLPNANSEIVDNDTRGGNTSSDRFEYNAAAAGTEDFSGYYLSSKLFIGKVTDDQWAKWRPSTPGTYKLFVHVPSKIPNAGRVTYKVVSGGVITYMNAVDHNYQPDTIGTWMPLTSITGQTQFTFDSAGYVGLFAGEKLNGVSSNSDTLDTGKRAAVDAVKFIWVNGSGVTAPTAPSNPSATAVSSSQINLRWSDNSNNEDGFRIYRWNGSAWIHLTNVGAGINSYSNTGLSASTTYYYKVCSYNSAGESCNTNFVQATTLSGSGGCSSTSLPVPGTANGTLSTTDCMLSDGSYYDKYTFSATAYVTYTITLNSSAFDAYLLLANSTAWLAENDDGNGGSNSKIVYTPTTSGTLTIYANSFYAGKTGAYTVAISRN